MEPDSTRARLGGHTHAIRGRDTELAVTGQHLDDLLSGVGLSGVGTVVLVERGAGMRKSRLLCEVEVMARSLSIGFGKGVADPADTVVQLAVLLEALFEGPTPILETMALGDAFVEQALTAKAGCPVSRALAGAPEITLEASLDP